MLELFGFYIDAMEIFSFPNLFLIGMAIFWMTIASIQDIRKREVENWWNFSFIIFALAFRAILSLESSNYWFFAWGVIGFVAGFILANIFYYSRMFAGGDAKLLMALGAVLPLSLDPWTNFEIFILFLILFLFAGSIYGLLYSLFNMFANFNKFKKEFMKQFEKYKVPGITIEICSLILLIIFYFTHFYLGFALSAIFLFTPSLLIYAKSLEESCMIKARKVSELTIGDWLYKPLKIGKKKIEPNWEGLSEKELKLIQNNYRGRVLIKQGLPFVPAFLIAFIIMLFLIYFRII